jgi:hypothetical protein
MNELERELEQFGEQVKAQSHNGSTMMDLVFDPITGDFKQVPKGTKTGPGEVVTEMTKKGFAI